MLFPGVWHRYQPDPKTGWHEFWIGFDGETARNWQKNKFISAAKPVVKMNMGWCLDCHEKQPNATQLMDCVICHR